MPTLLNLIGVLKLEDEEFTTLLEIFSHMPMEKLLCSAYIALQYKSQNMVIPDSVIAELAKMIETIPQDHKWFSLIDRILEFRARATISISHN